MRTNFYNFYLVASLTMAMGACAEKKAPNPTKYKTQEAPEETEKGQGDTANQQPPEQQQDNVASPPPEASLDFSAEEKACIDSGFYYDLLTLQCTQRALVKVSCNLENITNPEGSDYLTLNPEATSDFLADNQKTQITGLFADKLAAFTLRYCIDDIEQYTLVAVKVENGQYILQDLDVPK